MASYNYGLEVFNQDVRCGEVYELLRGMCFTDLSGYDGRATLEWKLPACGSYSGRFF